MTTSKSGQSQALVPTGRQTNSCALACAKRSRENFLFDLDNKKSIESTRNVYPIWREAMSTHLAPCGLKTISTFAGLALDTLEWSGPVLLISQTSSACRWKASPGLVSSPLTISQGIKMHLFACTDLDLRPETSSYCDVRTCLQRHDKEDTP